ncbi:amino acid ABC transporter substrate-binding protein, PAAT family [Marinomonas polaris DSM 16579]|uniref:Amino acid ABC transporter substrate-binding protein, PAAT family n=1 Tax=Marinomonas polaris DSM 16579 TaxID=1122206 RepID=A0A1M5B7E1_9GAMM|nr:transporter substrate-binding domain-containing protein [Marinomonas polaris]SHF38461.1 amino acid ABC transporter substrate-binding protein, PAAT family [Marinomonas polaris DSM 16579]
MSRYCCIALWIIGTLFCRMLKAEEVVLYTVHFPPYTIDSKEVPSPTPLENDDGLYGLDVDLIRAAYKTQGISVQYKIMPWSRVMRDIEAGLILGGISCHPIPERESFAIFSDPVSLSSLALVTRRDFLSEGSHSLQELKNYKTLVVNGWAPMNILDANGVGYSLVNEDRQGLTLLLRRNHDVFMTGKESIAYDANLLGVSDQLSLYDIKDLEYSYYTVCFSQFYKKARMWRDKLNVGLESIKKSGVSKAIYASYGIPYPEEGLVK